jgi:hypothetical protein
VEASVIVENDTIETVIGHARRRRALPGRSDQESEDEDTEERRPDMTSLERGGSDAHGKASPRKGSQEPSFDAENEEGSFVRSPR